MNARIRVIDVESTGDSPNNDEHGLCEIGYHDLVAQSADLAGNPCDWEVVEGKARLCHPGRSIPPETAAVHHILDEDVAGEPNWKPLLRKVIKTMRDDGVIAIGAHGADMEQKWIHPDWWGDLPPLPFVCTYKSALRIWPDAPLHSNMGLRYHRMPIGMDRQKALPAHRAGPDAYVTAFHLRDLLNAGTPLEQMQEWTKLPALTVRCYMGDYRNGGKGTLWPDVPTSMLQWIVSKGFEDKPDVRYTVDYHLEQRRLELDQERERQDLKTQFRANGLEPDDSSASTPSGRASDPNQGALL